MRLSWLWLVIGLAGGCTEASRPEVVIPGDGGTATGGASSKDAASDAPGSDGALPGDAATDAPVTPVVPLFLGLGPVPRSSLGPPSLADQLQTDLELISSGVRAVALDVRWDELFDGPSEPNETSFARLGARAELYAKSGVRVLLGAKILDRGLDTRPSGLTSWTSPAALQAAELLVDRLLAESGQHLSYLSFGLEVDRYFAGASSADRSGARALLQHALDHAHAHPALPSELQLGVTASLRALTQNPGPELTALLAKSDVVMASYLAFDASFRASPASEPAQSLDALIAVANTATEHRPIVLHEVGYPTDDGASGSESKQKTFYDAFFPALAGRRQRFPFVVAAPLHDGPSPQCAAGLGSGSTAAAAGALCSLGIRQVDGAPRAVQVSVFSALASFSAP